MQFTLEATGYLEHAIEEMNFSVRAHDRILKVARTLADVAEPKTSARTTCWKRSQYRSLDRKLFS